MYVLTFFVIQFVAFLLTLPIWFSLVPKRARHRKWLFYLIITLFTLWLFNYHQEFYDYLSQIEWLSRLVDELPLEKKSISIEL